MLFAAFFFSHGVKWDLLFFGYNKFPTGMMLSDTLFLCSGVKWAFYFSFIIKSNGMKSVFSISCYKNIIPKTAPKIITKIGWAFTLNNKNVNTA